MVLIIECDDETPVEQTIIPDGFTELIFHYGDPYLIRLNDHWEQQPMNLFAGQISHHFQLKNTGKAGMVAVKLKPTALSKLFHVAMHQYTNKVANLFDVTGNTMA